MKSGGASSRLAGLARGSKPLKRVEFKRTTAMKSGGGVAARGSGGVVSPTRLNPVSARRKVLNRELAAVVAAKRATVRYCQAQPLLRAALSHSDNTEADRMRYVRALQECQPWNPERPHHPFKRSRGSDATLTSAENILMVCPSCDDFSEAEVSLSTRAGLLIPSSSRQRFLGRLVS
jgi:hypothetical protein